MRSTVVTIALVALACWCLSTLPQALRPHLPLSEASSKDDYSPEALPVFTESSDRSEVARSAIRAQGTVVWNSGDPVKNCIVGIGDRSSRTDAHGVFELELDDVAGNAGSGDEMTVMFRPACWERGSVASVACKWVGRECRLATMRLPDFVDVSVEIGVERELAGVVRAAGATHWDVSVSGGARPVAANSSKLQRVELEGDRKAIVKIGYQATVSVAVILRFATGQPSQFVSRRELVLVRHDVNSVRFDVASERVLAGRVVDQFGVGVPAAKLTMLREGDIAAKETILGVGEEGAFIAFPPEGQSVRLRARHAEVEVVAPGCSPGSLNLSLMLDLRERCVVRVVDSGVPVSRFLLGSRLLYFGARRAPSIPVQPYGEASIECAAPGARLVLTWIEGDGSCREEIVSLPPPGVDRTYTIDVALLPRTAVASLVLQYGDQKCLVMLHQDGAEVELPYRGRQIATGSNTPSALLGLPVGRYKVVVAKGSFEAPVQWQTSIDLVAGENVLDVGAVMCDENRMP